MTDPCTQCGHKEMTAEEVEAEARRLLGGAQYDEALARPARIKDLEMRMAQAVAELDKALHDTGQTRVARSILKALKYLR